MTPEEKQFYPESTVFLPVINDPTIINRQYYVETIIHFALRFDLDTERTFLLDRNIISDDFQGLHPNGTS